MSHIEESIVKWHDKENAVPEHDGWYPVIVKNGGAGIRLWEDNCWMKITWLEPDPGGEGGGLEFVPNDSFVFWAEMDTPLIARNLQKYYGRIDR